MDLYFKTPTLLCYYCIVNIKPVTINYYLTGKKMFYVLPYNVSLLV